MAKPNVHTASRDELVEAGIRAELADEILKLRRKGKIDLVALDEVPGVGPATLEQLRKSLDFRDQPKNGDDRGEPTARTLPTRPRRPASARPIRPRRSAGARPTRWRRSASVPPTGCGGRQAHATVRGRAEVGKRAVEQTAEVTRELTDRTGNLIQQGLRVVQGTTDAVRELPREVARQSAEGTAEIGRTLLGLAHEQTRQNLDTMQALATAVDWNRAVKAVDWERVFEIQGEFLRASLERSAQLTQRYLEVTQTVMTATASAARQQARKAA